MSIVEQAVKATTAKRITYGIEIRVLPFPTPAGEQPVANTTTFTLNEWGLHESQAKEVNELLILNGDKPVTVGALEFTRRAPSTLSSMLAAAKANLAAQSPAGDNASA